MAACSMSQYTSPYSSSNLEARFVQMQSCHSPNKRMTCTYIGVSPSDSGRSVSTQFVERYTCLDVLLERLPLAGDAEAGESDGHQGHQAVDRVHLHSVVKRQGHT